MQKRNSSLQYATKIMETDTNYYAYEFNGVKLLLAERLAKSIREELADALHSFMHNCNNPAGNPQEDLVWKAIRKIQGRFGEDNVLVKG